VSLSERADLVARLSLDDKFSKPLSGAQKKLKGFGSALGGIGKTAGIALGAAASVASAVVVKSVSSGLDSLAQLEDATTSVDGAIKKLGLTGQVTSGQIAGWANEIEAATQAAFDDKDITAAATTLLRYGKVAPGSLKETLTVMTDLAAKTGSVDSAASKLAKSLADPTKATRVLREVGVTLTDEQQKQIKTWVATGKLGKAQALILKEVAKQVGGAAAAMNGPYRDSQLVFADVTEDAQRALATGFLPVLEEVRTELSAELSKKGTLDRIKEFGTGLAGGLKSVIGFVKSIPWSQVGDVLKGAADFGKNLAGAFMGLPTEAKALIIGLAGLNKLSGGAVINVGVDLLKGTAGTLFQQFLGKGSPANPMFVVPVGGGLGGGGLAGAAGAAGGGLKGVLGTAVKFIVPVAIGWEIGQAVGTALAPYYTQLVNEINPKTKSDNQLGSIASLAKAQADAARNLQALPENISAKQAAKSNTLRDKMEGLRIATTTRLSGVQSGIVSGAHSDRNAIVTAIRGIQRPIVHVSVSQSYTRVSYASGGTVSRYAGKIVPTS
jgi:hypothetical protein